MNRYGGRATECVMAAPSCTECNQTPNAIVRMLGSHRAGDNVRTGKEKSPRSPNKVPKFVLSGKGCGVVKTARRLA